MKVATADERPAPLADRLRQAISDSRMSFSKLARLAKVGQPQLSRFMAGERDLTLSVASNVCQVLGLDLVRAAPVMETPLDAPELTPRKRREAGAPLPLFAETRGQGMRIDLLGAEAATGGVPTEPPARRPKARREVAPPASSGEEPVGQGSHGDAKSGGSERRKARRRSSR